MISKKIKIYTLVIISTYLGILGINTSFAFHVDNEDDSLKERRRSESLVASPESAASPGEETEVDHSRTIGPEVSFQGLMVPHGSHQTLSQEWRPSLLTLRSTMNPTHFLLSRALQTSKTFVIMPAAIQHFDIDATYLPAQYPLVDGHPDREGVMGFIDEFKNNPALRSICVSDPYKQLLYSVVNERTPMADLTGAVNFVTKNPEGKLVGDNKDGEAFVMSAEAEGVKFVNTRMVFFGCGGVSSAVSIQLALERKLSRAGLVDPEVDRRETLAQKLRSLGVEVKEFDSTERRDFSGFNYFYNGTGLGKAVVSEGRTPLHSEDIFPRGEEDFWAFDANYAPQLPPFLEYFKQIGALTLNGAPHMVASSSFHVSHMRGDPIPYKEFSSFVKERDLLNVR